MQEETKEKKGKPLYDPLYCRVLFSPLPFRRNIPRRVDERQQKSQNFIPNSQGVHVLMFVRVYNLVPEGSEDQVRLLGNEENILLVRLD